MHKRLRVLVALVTQCDNRESLLAAERLLNSAKGALKAISRTVPNTFLHVRSHEPANKRITSQRSFYCTKKRRRTPLVRIAKPTQQEKEQISSSLLQRIPLYSSEKGKQGVPRDRSKLKIDGITVTFKLVIFQQGSKCPQTHPSRISRVLIE